MVTRWERDTEPPPAPIVRVRIERSVSVARNVTGMYGYGAYTTWSGVARATIGSHVIVIAGTYKDPEAARALSYQDLCDRLDFFYAWEEESR